MLVLSRKIGEGIRIADNVSVTVLKVRGNVVTLGLQGPQTVTIHREEVYKRIWSEALAHAEASPGPVSQVIAESLAH